MNRLFAMLVLSVLALHISAQDWTEYDKVGKWEPTKGLQYNTEAQGSFSHGKTPLWLNANKYGLSSLEETNGYVRGSVIRPLQTDSLRKWGIGYGADIVAPYHYTSHFIVQQAFLEGRWKYGVLTIGSKEYPMELKNNQLSSGSQTLGINARPVPQVRLALPNYWIPPFGNGWIRFKGHVSYGWMTDENWQHDFTQRKYKYVDGALYHSKAGFIKIGNEERFYPLSLELGVEMASTFGGMAHIFKNDGTEIIAKGGEQFKNFWKAFVPGGSEVLEEGTPYQNAQGNQLGSWLLRVNYDEDDWRFSVYVDKYFEDHSSMFQLDYDGYGTDEEWNKKKKNRYQLYSFKDWMLGAELNFKYNRWLKDLVFEYIYTKYQSGPIYHDHSMGMSNHISGNDDFYNHYVYTGWQHWGQVMGNPLYLSPIYNDYGIIYVYNNRFMAFHLGIAGHPTERLHYRTLITWQDGLGTYGEAYTKRKYNTSFLVEADYQFNHQWNMKLGYAMDFGQIRGNNCGLQLTISKSGIFQFK
jgi:hypothetical protein